MDFNANLISDSHGSGAKCDTEGDVKVIFNYIDQKNSLDEKLSTTIEKSPSDFEIPSVFANKLLEKLETHTAESEQAILFANVDQASSSKSIELQNAVAAENKVVDFGIPVGQVVWSSLSRSKWYPGLVEDPNVNGECKL
jgi:hypothetical protein